MPTVANVSDTPLRDSSSTSPSEPGLTVIFVAGDSRSASTLLERTLGECAGICSIGELRYLWDRGLRRGGLCGCGVAIAQCSFWRDVLQPVLRSENRILLDEICRLQCKVDRPDRFLRTSHVSLRRFGRSLQQARQVYAQVLGELYASISDRTGCKIIVDSSKAPSHGSLLQQIPGIRLAVVHLVRDCRAVMFSMQRRKAWPTAEGGQQFMPTYNPYKGAIRWTLVNTLLHQMARQGTAYHLLRYEDFVRQPKTAVEDLAAEFGLPEIQTSHITENTIQLSQSHSISGNPNRFTSGEITIKLDDEWRAAMPRHQKLFMTALAAPLLLRYGYLNGGRHE
ncbi:MAG: sulfotransferase [Planctomycetota bacterium]|nr:sulfotransferase [Planctomycetota bacterium]